MRGGQHTLGSMQMAGDDLGLGLLQQKTAAIKKPLHGAGARHAALGKENQLAPLLQMRRHLLDGVG